MPACLALLGCLAAGCWALCWWCLAGTHLPGNRREQGMSTPSRKPRKPLLWPGRSHGCLPPCPRPTPLCPSPQQQQVPAHPSGRRGRVLRAVPDHPRGPEPLGKGGRAGRRAGSCGWQLDGLLCQAAVAPLCTRARCPAARPGAAASVLRLTASPCRARWVPFSAPCQVDLVAKEPGDGAPTADFAALLRAMPNNWCVAGPVRFLSAPPHAAMPCFAFDPASLLVDLSILPSPCCPSSQRLCAAKGGGKRDRVTAPSALRRAPRTLPPLNDLIAGY